MELYQIKEILFWSVFNSYHGDARNANKAAE